MPPRIVSVDYGTKRVGLSMADPLHLFAHPLDTCSPESSIEKLISLHKRDTIRVIVIGWPLNEDGTEGEATRRVDRYIHQLCRRLPDVEIIRWDERYTSEEAKSRLAGRHGKKGRRSVDQVAACIILQEYLESISETTGLN
ncbi:MAG: Holliday junction resolvase RuvX [Rhodothermaceae bacterium]|nr:Holliday junction resolvase RuvX [Rhodothermaceae bacterium]MXW32677.1 Holliday junction resolvase RuvX [Rhodothermaceae bacterium]MXX97134.1 Holliday junction resolvase RuvX [Rhodothermaceae bacterium]MXZ17821.1 Holliday junction resolvase RuvX [Rhodothermaceae bacterium]MXZ58750.1 Holliday junction resolvase RuvX [Rhodothermaceae bacterium]